MRSSSREPEDDLAELRRLINQPEQDELRDLRDRLDDKEQRAREIAAVLPEAIALSRDRGEKLTDALQPVMEASVRESIEKRPEILVEALRRIIGPVMRRSIADGLRAPLRFLGQRFSREEKNVGSGTTLDRGRDAAASRRNYGARFALALGAGLILAALIVGLRSELRWRNFVRRLEAEPGIAVTRTEKGWIFRSRVAGLRDPAAVDPGALARAAGVDPGDVEFVWKDFLALDDSSVRRRFEKRFGKPAGVRLGLTDGGLSIGGTAPFEWIRRVRAEGMQSPGVTAMTETDLHLIYDPRLALARFQRAFPPPAGVSAKVADGTLRLAGTATYEWLARVREGAAKLPGIERISEDQLQVVYDATTVLQRFIDRYNLPDTVNATVEKKILLLSGEAPHGWLTRVRRGARTVPGIETINERNLIDIDQSAFQQSKKVVEEPLAYFPASKDDFTTEGLAALALLPEKIQRCLKAAAQLGLEIRLEVRGYADSAGNQEKNFELSRHRAEAVRDFLVKGGLKPSLLDTMAMGVPPPATGGMPEQAARQVELKVVPKK